MIHDDAELLLLSEAKVRPGPDTFCMRADPSVALERETVEHRFEEGARVCICGQVQYVEDGWRGRMIVLVRPRLERTLDDLRPATEPGGGFTDEDVRRLEHPDEFA